MGPHSFECGIHPVQCMHECDGTSRFNGAALIRVRNKSRSPCNRPERAALQWGRTHSSAEYARRRGVRRRTSGASMGPHSFECGIDPDEYDRLMTEELQWGRTHSSAE